MFMGFWQVGNDSRMDSRQIIATSELTKPQKHTFSCYFPNIVGVGGGPRKVDDLPTSPNNQFQDYFIRNRIEKLVPLNWNFAPHTLKTEKNRPNCFQTFTFCRNLGFQKLGICPRYPPQGVYISRNDPPRKKNWEMSKTSKIVIC